MNTSTESTNQTVSRRELLWFMLGTLAFIVLEMTVFRGWSMLTKPFWLDEISTYLIAGTQSVSQSIRNLAAGADSNPPVSHLLFRAARLITGKLTPITAHVVTASCVIGALSAAYRLLRTQFAPWPSALGAMAVWTQQVVMHAAFDARFYAPLLLASGWAFVMLLRAVRREPTVGSVLALALASVALCTVHYFGILTWAIAIVTVTLFAPGSTSVIVRRLVPSAAGPVALVASAPFYLGQRAALTTPTWMPDLTFVDAIRLLAIFLLTLPAAIALLCWAVIEVRAWLARRRGDIDARPPALRLTRPLATGFKSPLALGPLMLLTQVGVPFVIMAFSLLVQPATEPRYYIVGAFAVAPLVALVVSRGDMLIRWVATAGMVAASVKTMRGEAGRADAFAHRVNEDILIATELARTGTLVVTRFRDTLYPIVVARPELGARMAALDATPLDSTNRFFIFERDLGRINTRLYGLPPVMTPAELGRVPSFYFIEPKSGEEPSGAPTDREFPEHVITRVGERTFHLVVRTEADH